MEPPRANPHVCSVPASIFVNASRTVTPTCPVTVPRTAPAGPIAVATIVSRPMARARTTPDELMLAAAVSETRQDTTAPGYTAPNPSRATTENFVLSLIVSVSVPADLVTTTFSTVRMAYNDFVPLTDVLVPGAIAVTVNCLLYTSPSPRDRQK